MSKGKILSKREHVLHRPDMYIGSIRTQEEEKLVYSESENKIISKKILYNEGLERIFIEILSNAIDNKWESEEVGEPMTKVSITIDEKGLTTISNDGRWIPIEKTKYEIEDERHPGKSYKMNLYPAESYFGYMLSGTNYDDKQEKRKTSGKNGIGAKATNIYAETFTVTCIDPENKKKFIQTFSNNMTIRGVPKITPCSLKKGLTEISFLPDFKRFNFQEGYTDDFKDLLKKHAYDCAMVTGLSVIFNGANINIKNLQTYAKLYLPPETKMMTFESDDCEVVLAEQTYKNAKDGFRHISFVNGVYTKKGGVHVDAWTNLLLGPIRDSINGTKTKEKVSKIKIKLEQIKKYFFIFLKTELDKPEFESQSKYELTYPKPQIVKLDKTQIKKILKWDFLFFIHEEIKAMEDKKIAKTDGKKNFMSFGKKADDANWAGKEKRLECILLITEGLSAKSFATAGIASLENGHDKFGTLALRGKLINSTNHSAREVNENVEIQLIKNMLGLEHGKDYSKDENFEKLRYGKIVILCDSDTDGYHIEGLVMNYFWNEFSELIDRKFVCSMNTPAVRVTLKNKKLTFYSHHKFKEWQNSLSDKETFKVRYYKGLGTNTVADASESFNDQKRVTFYKNGDEEYYMRLGFSDGCADLRKDWLIAHDPSDEVYEFDENNTMVKKNTEIIEGYQSLSDFVDNKLIFYHKENIDRMIPNVIDGLKESQRKILDTCIKSKIYKECVKVVQLAGDVMKTTCYHHGEASLNATIIKMGQGYVGSNNIPLLVNEGMIGTRTYGGEDAAAPRYLFTRLEHVIRKIFREDDDELLERVIDEGKIVEPKNYVPIIPMILVNGAKGVASGFSTDIPSYNPMDLVKWIEIWIRCAEGKKESYPELIPWWRNYNGTVYLTGDDKKILVTRGIMEKDKRGKYHITELPIKTWTAKFKEYLEEKFLKERHITDLKKYIGSNDLHFILTPHKDFEPDIDMNLNKMVKSTKITNMVALLNERPKKYDTVEDILKDFCIYRLKLYDVRKKNLLKKWTLEYKKDLNRCKFIKEIIEKTLIIFNRDEQELYDDMKKRGYSVDDSKEPYGYLLNMSIRSMTKQRLSNLKRNISELKQKISILSIKSEGDLWIEDLKEFELEYAKFLKTRKDGISKK